MSHVGKKPIEIPESITVSIDGNLISVKGKLGELNLSFNALFQTILKKLS